MPKALRLLLLVLLPLLLTAAGCKQTPSRPTLQTIGSSAGGVLNRY